MVCVRGYSSSKALSEALLSESPRKAIGAPSWTLGNSTLVVDGTESAVVFMPRATSECINARSA